MEKRDFLYCDVIYNKNTNSERSGYYINTDDITDAYIKRNAVSDQRVWKIIVEYKTGAGSENGANTFDLIAADTKDKAIKALYELMENIRNKTCFENYVPPQVTDSKCKSSLEKLKEISNPAPEVVELLKIVDDFFSYKKNHGAAIPIDEINRIVDLAFSYIDMSERVEDAGVKASMMNAIKLNNEKLRAMYREMINQRARDLIAAVESVSSGMNM